MENINFIFKTVSLIAILLAAVYLLGIIWRTEMKLDKAYKLLFIALTFLIFFEVLEFLAMENFWLETAKIGLKFLFSLFFLFSILEMRNMIRDVDGEKNENFKK